ncbi:hypothetical protein PILCRDRAFT_70673 [Piloderma croceum F 1598]|uniref:Cytochrome P450 n=1 Tax=Piloderma croceum (strain F 1598) TaxID=765440 RepID=A0A0C3FU73_PILCF|nr:hypothetical protein PILCRDRAFT_70673 [Piloderma croceum F 1598]
MAHIGLVKSVLLALLSAVLLRWWMQARHNLPLPPRPQGLPIIGNYFNLPKASEKGWLTYRAWGETYALFVGDVCSVSVGGQTIVVLNFAEAADDLMVK